MRGVETWLPCRRGHLVAAMGEEPPRKKRCGTNCLIEWPLWHNATDATRINVLKSILDNPSTDNKHKIFLVGERLENFQHEDQTVQRIKDLEKLPKYEKGTPEYEQTQSQLMECMMELVMMKALVYDTEGRASASASSSASRATPSGAEGCRVHKNVSTLGSDMHWSLCMLTKYTGKPQEGIRVTIDPELTFCLLVL